MLFGIQRQGLSGYSVPVVFFQYIVRSAFTIAFRKLLILYEGAELFTEVIDAALPENSGFIADYFGTLGISDTRQQQP